MIIYIFGAIINRCTGCGEKPSLIKVHVLYSEPMLRMTKDEVSKGWKGNKMMELQCKIEELKRLLVRKFSVHCISSLRKLKFHLLDYVVEELRVVETLTVLDASLFEHTSLI